MEFSAALEQNIFGFVSALIGGVVGGYFTLLATNRAIREENDKENRRDEKEIENLLNALRVEISTLWNFHVKKIGPVLEELPEGGTLEFYYPLTQDYFTVYNANASVIGRITDPSLMEAIVIAYNKCKKVVDGYSYNNELYEYYRRIRPSGTSEVADQRQQLVESARMIKTDHTELKGYIEDLMMRLEEKNKVLAKAG